MVCRRRPVAADGVILAVSDLYADKRHAAAAIKNVPECAGTSPARFVPVAITACVEVTSISPVDGAYGSKCKLMLVSPETEATMDAATSRSFTFLVLLLVRGS